MPMQFCTKEWKVNIESNNVNTYVKHVIVRIMKSLGITAMCGYVEGWVLCCGFCVYYINSYKKQNQHIATKTI